MRRKESWKRARGAEGVRKSGVGGGAAGHCGGLRLESDSDVGRGGGGGAGGKRDLIKRRVSSD